MPAVDLVVLGAGPAGLGAAYRAARSGHRVVVLEREGQVGGAARSLEVAGQRVDLGSHRLHRSVRPEVLATLRTLLGDELQERLRRGRIRLEGRWVGFPLQMGDAVRNLPPSFAAAALRDAAVAPLRRPRADTFAEHLRAGLGPTMTERFYFPYARKLWGLEPDRISAEQARRRVQAGSPLALARRLVAGGDDRRRTFLYPAGGYGRIAEALAEGAEQAGADVRLDAPVSRVRLRDGGVEVDAGGEVLRARACWSTIPLSALARLADPAPPPGVVDAARSLRTRAMVLCYLVLDTDRYTAYDAHYLPGAETPVTRVSEPKNYRDSAADPPGRTVLCAELPCTVGDDIWTADEAAVGRLAAGALVGAGLEPPAVTDVQVVRLPHAYPVYAVGFEEAYGRLLDWADAQPALLTFGRQGLFVHDNTHHALAMAWDAADALRGDGSLDRAAWDRAREGFRSHVVED